MRSPDTTTSSVYVSSVERETGDRRPTTVQSDSIIEMASRAAPTGIVNDGGRRPSAALIADVMSDGVNAADRVERAAARLRMRRGTDDRARRIVFVDERASIRSGADRHESGRGRSRAHRAIVVSLYPRTVDGREAKYDHVRRTVTRARR